MPYVTRAEIDSGPVPHPYVIQALDDDRDNAEDEGKFDALVANVATQIDAILGSRYTVPFTDPVPKLVNASAANWLNYLLYNRRGVADDKNPCYPAHKATLALLQLVASGKAVLDGVAMLSAANWGGQERMAGRIVNPTTT
jgi:phage gp36-like protein